MRVSSENTDSYQAPHDRFCTCGTQSVSYTHLGNPDKLKQAFSVNYGKYSIEGLDELKKGVYESIHGGYDTTDASNDPHRLIPLDVMRDLEAEGKIKSVFDYFYTTCGVGTNVETSKEMGRKLAEDLKLSLIHICQGTEILC